MITVLNVLDEKRANIPAVVHVDGTARPQTVSRHINPRYWGLISEFEKLTGVPLLLNTHLTCRSHRSFAARRDQYLYARELRRAGTGEIIFVMREDGK